MLKKLLSINNYNKKKQVHLNNKTNFNIEPNVRSNLFHKYYLQIADPNDEICFTINNNNINLNNKFYCHIHCLDLAFLENYFGEFINNYIKYFNIVITYSYGEIKNEFNNTVFLNIKNKGADIGGKICMISFLYENKLDFDYILFMHSKTDNNDRLNYINTFLNRAELLITLLNDKSKKIDAIIPNYHNIFCSKNINRHIYNGIQTYINEYLSYYNINYNIDDGFWFNGTNIFLFSKKIVNFIFPIEKIKYIYNSLNFENSFDYNWVKLKYNINDTIENTYKLYLDNNYCGNSWNDPNKSLPNGCIEHMFEKNWMIIIKHLNLNYVCLPVNKICDFYNIKINAIFFPQFHDSKENNEFWENGFTEWTLLKPFYDEITIRDYIVKIMKPHNDIGYYSLDDVNTFKKQIEIAKKYNINGFVFYHYWFNNNRSVLNKLEEHLLRDDINIPFCFSWANEPWTRQWDGSQKGILLNQDYEDSNNLDHINYLIKFFKKDNYIKNKEGECLFYIYNYVHIQKHINKIFNKWKTVLNKNKIKIKIISTKNADIKNHVNGTDIKYDFLPLSQLNSWTHHQNDNFIVDNKVINSMPLHYEIDYSNLIEKYNSNEIKDNYHLGLPLNWNNLVRKKNIPHLNITNFNKENLRKMLLLLISKIILRYQNKYLFVDIEKYNVKKYDNIENNFNFDNNIIIVNAWNEWNEQAILEPNNITGYENLETINNIITYL